MQVEPKHIAQDETFTQRGESLQHMGGSLAVHLHAPQIDVGAIDQVNGERTCSRSDLDHRSVATMVCQCIGDGLGDTAIVQEVLPELFLGADRVHRGWMTSSRVRKAANLPSKCFIIST